MINIPTPPPIPYQIRRKKSYGTKIVMLGLQCVVLMIGAMIIWSLVYSRNERSDNVAEQIAGEWGGPVYIQGPIAREHQDSSRSSSPLTLNCNAKVVTKSLHRNIYEAEVFNADVSMSGTFSRDSLMTLGDSAYILVSLKSRQIAKLSPLKFGNQSVEWKRQEDYIMARVDTRDIPETIDFAINFDIHGSGSLFVKQIGENSNIIIDGQARNPSFDGSSLPDERIIRDRNFRASWASEDDRIGQTYENGDGYVGTKFLVGVDRYQKVARALKYAFIIILLTYLSVLFTEMITKRNIPLLNYFLIGAALIIFYSLLLSMSEHVSFGIAYLIAAAMTVLLITGYMWKMLGSRKVAIIIGLILTGMYGSCYIMLTLSTYALLLGSLILFAALAAVMYGSLKLQKNHLILSLFVFMLLTSCGI